MVHGEVRRGRGGAPPDARNARLPTFATLSRHLMQRNHWDLHLRERRRNNLLIISLFVTD
jgi:hypothetical protein